MIKKRAGLRRLRLQNSLVDSQVCDINKMPNKEENSSTTAQMKHGKQIRINRHEILTGKDLSD